jgi:hypothetical protein
MSRVLLAAFLGAGLVAGCGSPAHRAAEGCRLRGSISLQGAAGSLLGPFAVRNTGDSACRLGGVHLALVRSDGNEVPAIVHRRDPVFPAGRALKLLRPGSSATAWIHWKSYCGSLSERSFTFRLTLADGARVAARTGPQVGIQCRDDGRTSAAGAGRAELSVSAFQAPA